MKAIAIAAFLAGCGGLDAHVAGVVDDMAEARPARDNNAFADMSPPSIDMTWPDYPDVCNSGCTPPNGPGSGPGGHPRG